jgi:hypothetical protein
MYLDGVRMWDLFSLGCKDALILSKNELTIEDRKTVFEYRNPFIELEGIFIFFQSDKLKSEFIEEGGLNSDFPMGYNSEIIGHYLNYPPLAIESYNKGIPEMYKVFVNFEGIIFVTHINHLVEDLKWMQSHIIVPDEHKKGSTITYNSREQHFDSYSKLLLDFKLEKKRH